MPAVQADVQVGVAVRAGFSASHLHRVGNIQLLLTVETTMCHDLGSGEVESIGCAGLNQQTEGIEVLRRIDFN